MEVFLWILSFLCFTYTKSEGLNNTFQEVNGTLLGNQTFSPADSPYLVTSELVISQNATLIVEAGTEVLLVPKVGIRVYGSLLATGVDSQRITFRSIPCKETSFCNSTNPTDYYDPGIRLVNGTSYNNGRLELKRNGRWGTICDRYWDNRDTDVACRQLGYLGAKRYYRHPGSGSIWLKGVGCRGSEKSIWQCSYYGSIGYTGCCK